MKTHNPLILLTLIALWPVSVHGAGIIYNFDSGSLVAVKSGADAANITASNFSGPGEASVSSSTNTAFLRSSFTGSDLTAALADTDYFTFTLTPVNVGETWQINSFAFQFGASTGGVGTSLTNTVVVQTSFGGTGTGNPTLTISPSDTKVTGQTDGSISLTSATAATGGISFSSASPLEVQFRFYDNMDSTSLINRLDNINLNVSAVPEPSAALLAALGVLGGVFIRRK